MRLAFVHGINNEGNTAESIERDWWDALVEGWTSLGLTPKPKPQIDVGYYGKILADAVAGRKPGAVAQGGTPATRAHGKEFIEAYLAEAGIDDAELKAALREDNVPQPQAIEQGRFQEILVDAAAAAERLLRRRGHWLASKFLTQATTYIEDEGLAAQIAVTVRQMIFDDHDDTCILIAHSLGTVVSYRLLADPALRTRSVPLFVTLGSPLGIGMMRSILPPRQTIPDPPIGKWVNGYRRDDFVALDRPLGTTTIGLSGVENITDGLTEEADKHSVVAYLKSPKICARIHDALG